MTPTFRHTSLALALLAFTTACHSAAPPPETTVTTDVSATAAAPVPPTVADAEKNLAPRQYAQIAHLDALGERCGWLNPVETAAVKASVEERDAWMVWQGLDTTAARAQADALIAQSANLDCKSAEGEQMRLGVGLGAWQMRSSWSLRAQAMVPGQGHPEWFTGKTSLAEYASALNEAAAGLEAIDKQVAVTSKTLFGGKAEQMLATRCDASDIGCPAADSDAGFKTYAEAVIKQAEAYAQVLSKADDKTGRPPEAPAR